MSTAPTSAFCLRVVLENTSKTSEPHAYYTRNFLLASGVLAEHILEPALSRFTLEDATLSQPIVAKYGARDLTVVTSDFHLKRAKLIFEQVFEGYKLSFRGSKTDLPQGELSALAAHEKRAIARLKSSPAPTAKLMQ